MTALLAGLIGILGGWYLQKLRSEETQFDRKAQKYEEVVDLIDQCDQWLMQARDRWLNNDISTHPTSPVSKLRAVCRIYFPELIGSVGFYSVASSELLGGFMQVCAETKDHGARATGFMKLYPAYRKHFDNLQLAADESGRSQFGERHEYLKMSTWARLRTRAFRLLK